MDKSPQMSGYTNTEAGNSVIYQKPQDAKNRSQERRRRQYIGLSQHGLTVHVGYDRELQIPRGKPLAAHTPTTGNIYLIYTFYALAIALHKITDNTLFV
jgi:hypothetical protein